MFLMMRNRLKVVLKPSDHPVCHFLQLLPLFDPLRRPKFQNFDYHIVVGVNSNFVDDEKSIKIGFKVIRPPRAPLFATNATLEPQRNPKINEYNPYFNL